MLGSNKVNDSLSRRSFSKEKSLDLIQQDDLSIRNSADNIICTRQSIYLLTFLKENIIIFWRWLTDCIQKEISFGLPFLLILIFFSTGVIFYFNLDREPSWKLFIILISTFLGVLYILRRYRGMWLITGFLFCIILGALAAKIETWRMSTTMLDSDVSITLTGRIVSIEPIEKGGFRLNVDVLNTEKPMLRHAPDRVRLIAKHLPDGLASGDGLYGKVRLRALSGPVRPGSYDFSFHNYFKRIGAHGIYLGKPIKISVTHPDTILDRVLQKIENLRIVMTQKINTAIGGEEGQIAAALITGQRGGISKDTNKALRVAGLAHILSISGLHMALLSGMVLIVIRSFLALFPNFSSYYSAKKFAAVVALIITAFYLVLSGMNIAAQRSFVMVSVLLIAVLCNHSAVTMRNFAIAGLVTVATIPHAILSPSFQMSFSATAALIAVFGWWSERRSSYTGRTTPSYVGGGVLRLVLSPLILICVSSLVAGSASGIYAAYHFANVAPLGMISNILALPVVFIFVMPFGLIAAFAMLVGLESLPLQIMGFGISLVKKIAYAVTAISPAFHPGFMPLSALVLLSLGLVGLTFFKTPIRFFFSIFIFIGIFVCMVSSPAQLIIANNMSLVGIINERKLYIDRYYASKFTLSIWENSFHAQNAVKPTETGPSLNGQFICNDNICTAFLKNKLKVAVLHGKTDQCITANIVIEASTIRNQICDKIAPITFTFQQLLSRGSVIMMKSGNIIWSSNGFHRPWNIHRQNSQRPRSDRIKKI
ncbi:ComEC/Rec2 family competence protein [Bartonella schoenbuchensis]|uniref:ComEC/Rec2-related protein n=1 Tax=Bartonella schoenbuchensis m07a TaxID=1094496 RepID=N6VEG7_9HYPH|nr:ComEC/Rec2 family competence protein [Bartonella schoenbuchensis]ENN91636.1 ComEC/Rec2-related protein [Bartonella schoenbuchensis m07a]